MSEEKREENTEELKAFEAALASLVPRADRFDRDRLMFLAGQQSRVGCAHQNSDEKSAHELRYAVRRSWWAKPTLRKMVWPTAFYSMTAVAAILAFLLISRPAIPTGSQDHVATNSSGHGKGLNPAISEIQGIIPEPFSSDRIRADRLASSPWLALLQSIFTGGNANKSIDGNIPASDSPSLSYPQLRDQILRRGFDSWQVAQYSTSATANRNREPTTNRELLKEYLPDLDKPEL